MSLTLANSDLQLKIAYEQEEMTPDEIAEDTGYMVEAVKAKLMQVSSKYRKDCGKEAPNVALLNFSDSQLERINDRMMELALESENERVSLEACKYIRDDKLGRKDVVKAVGNTTFNLLHMNTMLSEANNAALESVKGIGQLKSAKSSIS